MAAFDASSAIAKFVADASQTSLELPHMTNGQRKQAKKLVEHYPEVRCESYGFGAERCLHLFKVTSSDAETKTQHDSLPTTLSSFRIKNTFIDDVAPPEEESFLSRSLPLRSEETSLDVASILKFANQNKAAMSSIEESKQAVGAEPKTFNEAIPEMIVPLTIENLQVRNTFIHIGDASADQRAIQSMPHGMFKKCLLSEAAEAFEEPYFCSTPTSAGGDAPSFGESDVDADHIDQSKPLAIGALVMVEGLVKLPEYNGHSVVVEAWDEATERYTVLIASSSGCFQAKVKRENLRMILPCPR